MKISSKIFSSKPRTVCEVGTGGATCVLQCEEFLDKAIKLIFVEPNPASFKILKENFGNNEKFKLYNCAISNKKCKGKYYNWKPTEENASGFIEGVVSPMMVNHNYTPNEETDVTIVDFIKFSEIDDGEIDILAVDAEGAEWFVISDMISRPNIIVLETHSQSYKNPDMEKIKNWMVLNNYNEGQNIGEDTIYLKK